MRVFPSGYLRVFLLLHRGISFDEASVTALCRLVFVDRFVW